MANAKSVTMGGVAGGLRRRWWVIVVPVLVINTVAQMDKIGMSIIIANKAFLKALNLVGHPAVIGTFVSAFLLSYAIFHFFWAWFVRKYGPRTSALIGVSVWGLTVILTGVVHTAGQMILARIILGVSEAVLYPMATTFVANWFPVRERGRATTIWMSGNIVGGILVGLFVVTIIAIGDWRMVFYLLGIINILIPLPLVIFLMKDHPRQAKFISQDEVNIIDGGVLEKTEEVPKAVVRRGFIGNYRYWIAVVCWGLNNIYFWGWMTWMPTYLRTARHFSFKDAGLLYSLHWVFMLAATLLVGYLSDRWMRRGPFGGWGYVVAAILIWAGGVGIGNADWAAAMLVVAGLFQGIGYSMLQTLFHSIVPEKSMAAALGIGGGIAQLMAVASPAVLGSMLGASGFNVVVWFCAISLVIPGILILFLSREGY